MLVLPGVDIEGVLVVLVVDGVPVGPSDDHLAAPVEVVHHVLKLNFERLPINSEEIDVLL